MKIALDYDKTYNLDKGFWDGVIALADNYGHEVRIVTARSLIDDQIDGDRLPFKDASFPVIYCEGIAKRFFCHWFADKTSETDRGWDPDVWIDDKPEGIDKNSSATKEILKEWRASDDYKK